MQHQCLFAFQHEVVAVADCAGLHLTEIEAGVRFGMRKRHQQRTVDKLRDQNLLLPVGTAEIHAATSQYHRGKVRLECKMTAQRLHHQHRFHSAAAKAAKIRRKRHAQHAQRCQPFP